MTKPFIRIHNVETNEIVDREMNDDEFSQWEVEQEAQRIKKQAEIEAQIKRATALAKLEVLGLDEDDLKALGLQI